MRLDRLVSLGLSALIPDFKEHRAIILMYHSISKRKESRLHPYYKTVTTPHRFAEQMEWLAEAGAEVVPLETWDTAFTGVNGLRVIITFDDGFADFLMNASSVLQDHSYPATLFLPTDFIDTGKELLAGVKHLEWEDICQLSLEGFSFGSHTASHRPIERLRPDEIQEELQRSADNIKSRLGKRVVSFSCPFAFPQAHPETVSALRKSLVDCGYKLAVTTKIGTLSERNDPYMLKRIPVNSDDDKKLFLAKLHGKYNWLGTVQTMVRRTKKLRTNMGE